MKKQVAVFVDAGYFFAQSTEVLFGKTLPRHEIALAEDAIVEILKKKAKDIYPNRELLRIYWYDAPPSISSGPSNGQMRLANQPLVKLRLGTLNGSGQQKGVDALICRDIETLARNNAMDRLILLAGDEDLRLSLEDAQTYGVQACVLGIGSGHANIGMGLSQEADFVTHVPASSLAGVLTLRSKHNGSSNGTQSSDRSEREQHHDRHDGKNGYLGRHGKNRNDRNGKNKNRQRYERQQEESSRIPEQTAASAEEARSLEKAQEQFEAHLEANAAELALAAQSQQPAVAETSIPGVYVLAEAAPAVAEQELSVFTHPLPADHGSESQNNAGADVTPQAEGQDAACAENSQAHELSSKDKARKPRLGARKAKELERKEKSRGASIPHAPAVSAPADLQALVQAETVRPIQADIPATAQEPEPAQNSGDNSEQSKALASASENVADPASTAAAKPKRASKASSASKAPRKKKDAGEAKADNASEPSSSEPEAAKAIKLAAKRKAPAAAPEMKEGEPAIRIRRKPKASE